MSEIILSGNDQQNVPIVLEIARGLGYTATVPVPGRVKLERGSLGLTLFLGALAGKKFHISFTFDTGVDELGNTWLRFDQDGGLSAVKGGAIGYSKSKSAFADFIAAVRQEAQNRGILLGER